MRFTATIEGLDDLERDWNTSLNVLSDSIRRGVEMGVKEGAAYAKANHTYTDRTGRLTKSIRGRLETSTRGGAVGVIEATAPYAGAVENGTSPHEIRPKNDRGALRFEVGGEEVFAKVVRHPGTSSQPFMGPAALKAERVVIREVEIAEQRVAEIMNK